MLRLIHYPVRNELRTLRRVGRNHKKGPDTLFLRACFSYFPLIDLRLPVQTWFESDLSCNESNNTFV